MTNLGVGDWNDDGAPLSVYDVALLPAPASVPADAGPRVVFSDADDYVAVLYNGVMTLLDLPYAWDNAPDSRKATYRKVADAMAGSVGVGLDLDTITAGMYDAIAKASDNKTVWARCTPYLRPGYLKIAADVVAAVIAGDGDAL